MSEPTCHAPYSPGRNREQREAEERYEVAVSRAWRDPSELAEAITELDPLELAEIARLANSDPAAAGERFRIYARNAVHEYARFSGDCHEEIPPASDWNFPRTKFDPSDWAARCMGLDAHIAAARGIKPPAEHRSVVAPVPASLSGVNEVATK